MTNLDLTKYGIKNVTNVIQNPSYEVMFQAEMSEKNEGFEKGTLTNTGAVAVKTGVFTGRSPKDKFIVKDSITENTIWWDGTINKPIEQNVWTDCKELVQNQLSDKETIYVLMHIAAQTKILVLRFVL
jgi:phosphoenolpyruvate carboxykinase (ATP)